jgi:hypothetical protein
MINMEKLFFLACSILSYDKAIADGASWHFNLGLATPHFSSGSQNIFSNPELVKTRIFSAPYDN